MRKLFHGALGAIAATALALPASAEEAMMEGVSISGYMNHDMGFGSYDGGKTATDDYHQEIDAELTFSATGMSDGGLSFTAAMQIGASGGGGVDESNLTIGGNFGKIIIGAEDNAANRHGNKGIGGGYGGGGYYDCGETWQPARCGGPVGGGDSVGLQYDTPNVGGFQAGVSFQPDGSSEGSTGNNTNDKNIIGVGANFSGEFVGTTVTLGANFKSVDSGATGTKDSDGNITRPPNSVDEDWGVGVAFGIADTTLSIRYDTHSPDGGEDTTDYGVGVDHTMGAIKFGVGYSLSQKPGADHSLLAAGATYTLGGGASVTGAINAGQIDAPGSNMDMDDVGIGLRIGLSF